MTTTNARAVADALDSVRAQLATAISRQKLSPRKAALDAGLDPEQVRSFLVGSRESIQLRVAVRLALSLGIALRVPAPSRRAS